MPPSIRPERLLSLGLMAAVTLGTIVRLLPVFTSPLPVGDGGLFAAMIDDIRANGLLPPDTTSYNGLGIPFLYPPLGLMLGAFLSQVTGMGTLAIPRILPPIVAVACLLAFVLVARRTLPPVSATGAVLAYALMPHAFDWVVAGGGITRGLGLLAALLAMAVAAGPRRTTRTAGASGLLLGLSALVHPQTPIFGALGVAVIGYRGRDDTLAWVRWLATAGVVALVVTLPWLIPATIDAGTIPILAAGHRWNPVTGLVRLASLEFSGAAFMDLVTPFAVVGFLSSIFTATWRLPILLVLTYLASPGGGDFMGGVVWALLAGAGIETLRRAAAAVTSGRTPTAAVIPAAVLALFMALTSALGSTVHEQSKLQGISADQGAAMAWVADETPDGVAFLVATIDTWGNDEVSEWFPALAHRTSLGTVQGSEWLGVAGYARQESTHLDLVACIGHTADCYADVAARAERPDAWVFVPKGQLAGPFSAADCCPALRETLAEAGYEIVYDGPGATIAKPSD